MTNTIDYNENFGIICLIFLCILAALTSSLACYEVYLLNKKFDKQLLINPQSIDLITSRDGSGNSNNTQSSLYSTYSKLLPSTLALQDPEFVFSGSQVRKYFFWFITLSNFARFLGLLLEIITYFCFGSNTITNYYYLKLVILSKIAPSLGFFTTYSLVAVFLAQLYHTYSGTSFIFVRKFWFYGNILLYIIFILLPLSLPKTFFIVLFIFDFLTFLYILRYSYIIYKLVLESVSSKSLFFIIIYHI